MTLSDLLDQVREANPEAGTPRLVRLLLDEVFLYDNVLDLLYPAVGQWVTRAEQGRAPKPVSRDHSRAVERAAFSGPNAERSPESSRPEPYANPAQEAMRQLLATAVLVPGEGMVPWGALTPDLHRRRVAFLQDMKHAYVEGVNETVRRHENAIDLLETEQLPDLNAYAARKGSLDRALAP
jgi:hypothetical protein